MAARPWEGEGYLSSSKTRAVAETLFRPAGRKTPHPALRADLSLKGRGCGAPRGKSPVKR